MAKAVTLKNNNDEEVYPVTDLSLVNGNIPTGRIADNAITTDKIADNAVTSDKIDWATMSPRWKVLVASDNNHITVPGGYNFLRIRAFATMPAVSNGRMVMNSNNRSPGSTCYVNYFGRSSVQAAQGNFSQPWNENGKTIAVAYLEAVNDNVPLDYVIDVQAYRIGAGLISEVSCCARGNDQNYILKGEAILDSTDEGFDLHFLKGDLSPTEVHWMVEGLEK